MSTLKTDTRTELKLREARRLERIFIYHRWLYVVAIGLMALVYPKLPLAGIIALAGTLGVANIATWYLYRRLRSVGRQTALSLVVFIIDGLASWALMLLFIKEPSAIVYAIFALIVIEGAVRFSLPGSLVTGAFFIIGLSAAWLYRVAVLGMSFDLPAFVFWVGLITLVSIMVGMAVREGRKQRAYAESLATERTLLLERRRISNELHDTVLKSLQGLALEAHALGKTIARNGGPHIEERAHYIEEVCSDLSQEIRGVVFELRDDKLNEPEGFKKQIEDMVELWRQASGIKTEVTFSGEVAQPPLKLSHDLRRIIAEALANIQRHAGASEVAISFEYLDGHLKLTVADDGHGFDCARDLYSFLRLGKLGLVSMKERVELAGGIFEVNSSVSGTLISVNIPLAGAEKCQI